MSGPEMWTRSEIREAVDAMVREEDYLPERAQERIMELLGPGLRSPPISGEAEGEGGWE